MRRPLSIRWARFRASVARRLLDRLIRGKRALWLVRVGGTTIPQMEGRIIAVTLDHDQYGRPEALNFRWLADGHSIYDLRTVSTRALKYDRKLRMFKFYDC